MLLHVGKILILHHRTHAPQKRGSTVQNVKKTSEIALVAFIGGLYKTHSVMSSEAGGITCKKTYFRLRHEILLFLYIFVNSCP